MIHLSIEPPAVAAAVSRVVTVRIANHDSRALTNVVVGLDVPAGLGLEQGRSRIELARLDGGRAYEHVLRVRPPRPGHFTLDVPNLSFRNGLGRAQRERNCRMGIVVEPADVPAAPSTADGEATWRTSRTSIFISYRRGDSKMMVAPLVRDLGQYKALRHVDLFLDIRDIQAGVEWPTILDDELHTCELLVAVIGPNWMATRLHEPDDVVRREIAVALQRRIHLLPLLVDTTMPAAADLPSDVEGLTRWQAFRFDLDNYEGSVKRLAKRVSDILC